MCANRRRADLVTLPDFTEAIERIVTGIETKNRVLTVAERRVIAFQEMGHALTAPAPPGSDIVHKVSIVPHGVSALGEISTGAADDIAKATNSARDMVMYYAMEEELGYVSYTLRRRQFPDSPVDVGER